MFLIKISDSQEDFPEITDTSQETFKVGDFTITFLYDQFLTHFEIRDETVHLIESPINAKEVIYRDVELNINKKYIEISKKIISGRSLYYYKGADNSFYCSTHISLLRKAGIDIKENKEFLPEFFVYRYITAPNTFYENIYQFKPDETISIKLNNDLILTHSTNFNLFSPNKIAQSKKYSQKINTYLTSSLLKLYPKKSNISCLLSGGLDSSILYRILNQNLELKESYSTAYPFENQGNGDTESSYALSAAKALKADHKLVTFSNEDYLKGLIETIAISEEPLYHLQAVMFNLLYKKIEPNKNIIVSGQGADAFFGFKPHEGYFYSKKTLFKFFAQKPLPQILWKLNFKSLAAKVNYAAKCRSREKLSLDDPSSWIWEMGNSADINWVANHFNVSVNQINKGRENAFKGHENRSMYDLLTLLDFNGIVSSSQGSWSKIAEGNKKILYFPFNDENLATYTMAIPWQEKLKNPKEILRQVARINKIPHFIINRKKKGFYLPAKVWAGSGGVLQPLITLASKEVDIEILKELQSSSNKKGFLLWNFLNYAIWKRLHINGESKETLIQELEMSFHLKS